jgi:aryl-alcohol dehydrogenase-like predicted oxidoreductase
MNTVQLGQSDLQVTPICLGTMTFGEQVDEPTAHAILDRSLERGINFIDTAEMYAVPARPRPLAPPRPSSAAGWPAAPAHAPAGWCWPPRWPGRRAAWTGCATARHLTPADIVQACDDSLRRLQTDVIDLYQIHWPKRNVPASARCTSTRPRTSPQTSIHEQLEALAKLVQGRQGAPHRPVQ